jgi:putative ABC transport system permease protein
LAALAQRSVWQTVPGAVVSEVTSLDALLRAALAPARYRALLATIFAGLALLLTAVGLAGLTARAVATRLREFCIRMALGATPARALGLAFAATFGAVAAGLVAGLLIAPLVMRALGAYLFGISGRDAVTYTTTAVTALIVCALATLAATRRLRRVELAVVLRGE